MSDLPDKPKIVEIRRVDANQSLPKGYDLIDQGTVDGVKKPKALALPSGFVAHFDVPPGWQKDRDPFNRTFSSCVPTNELHVGMKIEDIGLPVAPEDVPHMKKLFNSKNLTLSSTDLVFLQKAINYGSTQRIIVQSARVHDIGRGERVIDFIGRYNYPNTTNYCLRCCLLDIDWTSRFLEPITFTAPPDRFNKYMPQVDKIFASMVTVSQYPPYRKPLGF